MDAFEKVIGYDYVKKELYKILDIINDPEKYRRNGVKLPHGILLNGIPGVGKTLLAKCFLTASGRKTFTIRKDKPNGEFVNHIRTVFEKAVENAPAIVFLDDMDKFSDEDDFDSNAEEYVTIQTCIDEISDKDVFVIATVNEIRVLPNSLRRSGRFDIIFNLIFPKNEDAKKIIEHYLEDKNVDNDIDAEEISRLCRGYSCADLEYVVNEAGLNSLYAGREKISQSDLAQACLCKFYGIDDDQEKFPEKVVRQLAVHEAGHTAVAEILIPESVDFVSISSEGKKEKGITNYDDEKIRPVNFEMKEANIIIALAGKAATDVVLGETDMGANHDLHKAFNYTRELLDNVAAYDFDSWCHGDETSQKVYDNLDRATAVEVSRYYKKAKQILMRNRTFLDAIVEKLVEKRTITYKEIKKIKASTLNA